MVLSITTKSKAGGMWPAAARAAASSSRDLLLIKHDALLSPAPSCITQPRKHAQPRQPESLTYDRTAPRTHSHTTGLSGWLLVSRAGSWSRLVNFGRFEASAILTSGARQTTMAAAAGGRRRPQAAAPASGSRDGAGRRVGAAAAAATLLVAATALCVLSLSGAEAFRAGVQGPRSHHGCSCVVLVD